MEQWSPSGLRIEIDYLAGRDAVWSDDLIPEMTEPAILPRYRRRVLQRVDERDSYRLAKIEDVDSEVIFPTLKRAREDAEDLRKHPDLTDVPIVENLPPEAN